MHILFSNHFCAVPKYGKSSRTFSLARELARLGHDVSIVTAGFSHQRDIQPEVQGAMATEMVSGVRMIYLNTPAYAPGNKITRLRNLLFFVAHYRAMAREIQRVSAPDVVVEGNAYTLPFVVSSKIAERARARLVYEVRDLWPLTLYEVGVSRWNPLSWAIGKVQSWALRRSDLLVSSLRFADRYFAETGRNPRAFAYIPNAADQTLFAEREAMPEVMAREIAELRARYPHLIVYAGSIGIANSVDRLIDAAQELESEGVAVLIIGSGDRKAELKTRVAERGQDNVVFLDPVPKVQVFDVIESCDLGFVGGRARAIHGYGVSPNKLYDYMICRVPVLFCLATEDNIVADANAGISVVDPTPDSIATGIREFFALSPGRRAEMGENGHQAIIAHYNYDKLAALYAELLGELTRSEHAAH